MGVPAHQPTGKKGAGSLPRKKAGGLPDFLRVDLRRIRPFNQVLRYGSAVGRVRALEVRYLDSSRLERLIDADFHAALEILDEVAMGDYLRGAETPGQVDAGLARFLRDFYRSLEGFLPAGSPLLDFFACKYDFHNLKVLLRTALFGRERLGLLEGLGRLGTEVLERGLDNPGELPAPFRQAVEEVRGRGLTPQEVDTVLDRHYLSWRLRLAGREGSPFLVDFARASIDLANMKALLRAKAMDKPASFLEIALSEGGFIPISRLIDLYGETREALLKDLENTTYYQGLLELLEEEEITGLADFDRRSDDFLMEMVRGTKRVSVGVEPIFAFVHSRENEVTIVRTVLLAKLMGLPGEETERILRRLYRE